MHERVTSYVVGVPASEVESYYKTTMPEYGWNKAENQSAPGLAYNFMWGGTEMRLAVLGVNVIVKSTGQGQTAVEVDVNGADETTPYWKQLWGASK